MQKALTHVLTSLAKGVLKKQQPMVVAVSGSVGKTSAKEAVFTVLKDWKPSGTSPKNYNNELGVPLSIIGAKAPGKNPFKWLGVMLKGAKLATFKRDKGEYAYPQVLVLEMGGDHVGDIQHLMSVAHPSVGVLTAIEATHTEFYGTVEAIQEEEGKVITMLPVTGMGVVNIDNAHAAASLAKSKAPVVTYGFNANADVHADEVLSMLDWDRFTAITTLKASVKNAQGKVEQVTIDIPAVLGSHSCYAPIAALATAVAVGIPAHKAAASLKYYVAPKGRMRVVPGLKGSLIIDDTYNASPAAVLKALHALTELHPKTEQGKRIAVLGNMAELGAISESKHQEIGREVARLNIDLLITVGDKAMDIAAAATEAGMSQEKVFTFGRTEEAGRMLQERMKPGDLILVKGSQSSRLERVVKEVMADPRRATELLVRQEPEWSA